jgi:hypothetical protein
MQGSGNGGWIVRTTSPSVNKGILAYAAGSVAGTYRTEDNTIAEGYTYSAGGFKIAIPAGIIDSLVTMNDDGSRATVFAGPWSVTAGQETDAGTAAGGVGRGLVRVSPPTLSGGTLHTITFTVLGESPFVITNAHVKIPSSWNWSHSTGDITLSGGVICVSRPNRNASGFPVCHFDATLGLCLRDSHIDCHGQNQ